MTTTKDTIDDCVRFAVGDLRDKGISQEVALNVVTDELANSLGLMIGHRAASHGDIERRLTEAGARTDAMARGAHRRASQKRKATGGTR